MSDSDTHAYLEVCDEDVHHRVRAILTGEAHPGGALGERALHATQELWHHVCRTEPLRHESVDLSAAWGRYASAWDRIHPSDGTNEATAATAETSSSEVPTKVLEPIGIDDTIEFDEMPEVPQ